MDPIKHTFLFEEGLWVVSGEYIDNERKVMPMEGTSRIIHSLRQWKSEGYMRLMTGDKVLEIRNMYDIVPIPKGKDTTTWKSFDPALGSVTGRFVVVDDSIISTLSSGDGLVTGVEYLVKVSDLNYRSRGFIFKGAEKISSWSAELLRANQALH